MKTLLTTAIACLCLLTGIHAQQQEMRIKSPSEKIVDPLVFVDSVETTLRDIWITPDQIESINVFKDTSYIARYGEKARNGILFIKTKTGTELLKLRDLITQYNLSIKDKNLKICMDKVLIKNPDRILATKASIVKVEVVTDTYWETPMIAGSEEKFINIVTAKKLENL